MTVASRKTHMVRIQAPKETKRDGDPGPMYVDIEVLDCIAYTTKNGEVHVWDCQSKNADPFIEDKTGDDPVWSTGSESSTRGSHAKEFTTKDADGHPVYKFGFEVMDRMAFRDDQNKAWILNYPKDAADPFNTTTHTGSAMSTRQTHLEQINATYTDGGTGGVKGKRVGAFGKNNDNKKNDGTQKGCIVQERVDIVAFLGEYEKRLVIKMESHDDQDPDQADPKKARAETITDPPDYDPNNKDGPKPPLLEDTQDKNKYFKLNVVHNKGGPVFGLSASGFEWSAEVTAGGAPNFGDTIFSAELFPNAVEALNNYDEIIATLGDFLGSPTISFVKGKPIKIGDIPPSVTVSDLDTGTIGKNNGADGTFISMGPLWWVRKWSPDGTD